MRFSALLLASLSLGVQAKPCVRSATPSTSTPTTTSSASATSSTAACASFVLKASANAPADVRGLYITTDVRGRGDNNVNNDYLAYGATAQSAAVVLSIDSHGYLYSPTLNEYMNIGYGGSTTGDQSAAYLNKAADITPGSGGQYEPICKFDTTTSPTSLYCNSSSVSGFASVFTYNANKGDIVYTGPTTSKYLAAPLSVICL